MCIDLHVKYPLFLYDFNENRIFSKVCRKYPNINYYENPHRGSQVVPRGQTDRHEATSRRFLQFANAPKNHGIQEAQNTAKPFPTRKRDCRVTTKLSRK